MFEFVLRNLRSYFVDVAGKNADVIIATNLLQQIMAMRMDERPVSTGALAANVREFEALRDFFTSGTLVVLVDLPFIFLFVGVIYFIAGPVAYIPLFAVPVVIMVGLILQHPLRRVMERTHQEMTQKHAILIEAIDGLETIKSSAAESRVQGKWEQAVGMTAASSGQARTISTLATTFAQVTVQLVTVFVVVYGVYLIADGELTMGEGTGAGRRNRFRVRVRAAQFAQLFRRRRRQECRRHHRHQSPATDHGDAHGRAAGLHRCACRQRA